MEFQIPYCTFSIGEEAVVVLGTSKSDELCNGKGNLNEAGVRTIKGRIFFTNSFFQQRLGGTEESQLTNTQSQETHEHNSAIIE